MALISVFYGIALIAIGLIGYFVTPDQTEQGLQYHPTALIPCGFGLPVLIMALVSLAKPNLLKHMMHGCVLVGLLGFLGTVKGVLGLVSLMTGGEVERPAAVISQSSMAILSAVYVGLCINSFIQARKRRQQEEKSGNGTVVDNG